MAKFVRESYAKTVEWVRVLISGCRFVLKTLYGNYKNKCPRGRFGKLVAKIGKIENLSTEKVRSFYCIKCVATGDLLERKVDIGLFCCNIG